MDSRVGRGSRVVLHNSARGPIVKAQRQGITVKSKANRCKSCFPFNRKDRCEDIGKGSEPVMIKIK